GFELIVWVENFELHGELGVGGPAPAEAVRTRLLFSGQRDLTNHGLVGSRQDGRCPNDGLLSQFDLYDVELGDSGVNKQLRPIVDPHDRIARRGRGGGQKFARRFQNLYDDAREWRANRIDVPIRRRQRWRDGDEWLA